MIINERNVWWVIGLGLVMTALIALYEWLTK